MTAAAAVPDGPEVPRPAAPRVPYAEASRVLLRHSILDGMRELLLAKDWSSITLSDVARAAGISRQTIYNEFGSRQGLAEGYAMRLADRLVDAVEHAIYANVGDIESAFLQGFRMFFTESASDPLVISLLTGVAKPDLLQIITTDSAA
ncbi:TetR family transcriptional regulator, partial [Mycolicibacterium mucogenicum]